MEKPRIKYSEFAEVKETVSWAIQTFIPMDARIKNLLSAVVVVVLLLWVLQGIGILTGGPVIRMR